MPESDYFRLFIAIAIPEAVKTRMEEAQAELRRVLPEHGVRWAPRGQFHLTLTFLGDVEAARVDALGDTIRAACRGFPPLRLSAQGVGCFPDLRRPRVVWVGVRDQAEELSRLQQAVAAATRDFTAEQKEQHFSGHVTLARIKSIRRPEAEALADTAAAMGERLFGQWTTYQVDLMRSELSPQGARHCPLASIALAERPVDLT